MSIKPGQPSWRPIVSRLKWRFLPSTWLAVITAALIFPLGLMLSPEAAWENSLVEWLQVVIFLMAAVAAGIAAAKGPGSRDTKRLWAWSVPVWLLMAGRELSWGRVFYVTSVGPLGPEFFSCSSFKFGWLVIPMLAFSILFIVGMILYQRLHLEVWRWLGTANFPAVDWSLGLLSLAISTVVERHLINMPESRAMVIEEFGELACYTAAFTIVIAGGFYREFQPPEAIPSSAVSSMPQEQESTG